MTPARPDIEYSETARANSKEERFFNRECPWENEKEYFKEFPANEKGTMTLFMFPDMRIVTLLNLAPGGMPGAEVLQNRFRF
ncbi:hypothetical protein, partial [Tatumella sp. UBA2305]|uniref:hypothetical protein n=1 Tax=Tatumella sp. UBA2305 TaxID=1947647 RepID=UPI0025D14D4A